MGRQQSFLLGFERSENVSRRRYDTTRVTGYQVPPHDAFDVTFVIGDERAAESVDRALQAFALELH